jgi:hypothetical protein
MAYVPGLRHDLFLSYAHEDGEWVGALQEQLSERLTQRLGCSAHLWQDENCLRAGQNWTQEIKDAIHESAAFVAVLSRNYQGSDWCERELDTFLSQQQGKLEAGGFTRFLKIVKFPWYKNAHADFYPEYQHVPFFERDPKTGQEKEFKRTSAAFRDAVDKLSFHIEQLFEALLREKEKIYVARAAEDIRTERENLLRHVKDAGFALSPPPDGAVPKGLDARRLREFMLEARASVHLFGSVYDRDARAQIELAIEGGHRIVFCVLPAAKAATGEQKDLIEAIRENRWNLPEGRWSLLESRSSLTLIQDLIALLVPSRTAETAGSQSSDTRRVYLSCDPTTPEDADFAAGVQTQVWEREKIRVELPPAAAAESPALQHERLLNECDGLLVYCDKAPSNWRSRSVADLLTVDFRPRRKELLSKALLVGGANMALPGLNVIHREDPFDLRQLESFLAPLRRVSATPGGAAYGGD